MAVVVFMGTEAAPANVLRVHPWFVGGARFMAVATSMVMLQSIALVAVAYYGASALGGEVPVLLPEATAWTVLSGGMLVYTAMTLCMASLLSPVWRRRMFTDHRNMFIHFRSYIWNNNVYDDVTLDDHRARALDWITVNYWRGCPGVKAWLTEKWPEWQVHPPSWFTAEWKRRIPAEMLPEGAAVGDEHEEQEGTVVLHSTAAARYLAHSTSASSARVVPVDAAAETRRASVSELISEGILDGLTEEDNLLRGDRRALAGVRRQSLARGGGAPQLAALTAEAGKAAATAFVACIKDAESDPITAANEFIDAQFGGVANSRLLSLPVDFVIGFVTDLAPTFALALGLATFGMVSRTCLGLFVTCMFFVLCV